MQYDQVRGSTPLVTPQLMQGVMTINEKLLQGNFSNASSAPPEELVEPANKGAEPTTSEVFHCAAYALCVETAKLPYQSEKEAMLRRYSHLQQVATTVENPLFNLAEFSKAAGVKVTKATHTSQYQRVIKLTDPGIGKDTASKRGSALEWVLSQCGGAENVAKYFEDNGGISKCYDNALQTKRDAEAQSQASTARKTLGPRRTVAAQAVSVTGLPVGVDGEFSVVIRMANGRGEVVSLQAPGATAAQSSLPSSVGHDENAADADPEEGLRNDSESTSPPPAGPEPEQTDFGAGDAADHAA